MGKKGKLEKVKEEKLEVIFPDYLLSNIIQSMNSAHPYEEVAYDIFKLQNNSNTGSGMIGELEKPTDELEFLNLIKKKFHAAGLRHTKLINNLLKRLLFAEVLEVFY